jgi:hypothetical protein
MLQVPFRRVLSVLQCSKGCRALLLSIVVIVATSSSPRAQVIGNIIQLYTDPAGTSCEVEGNPVGPLTFYVFHMLTPGMGASHFCLEQQGTNFVYVSETLVNSTTAVGNVETGGFYTYGIPCVPAPHQFLNVHYQATGTAEVCSHLRVVASPTSSLGMVEGVDCTGTTIPVQGWFATVNAQEPECDCRYYEPVEDASWGAIKALNEE